MNDKATLAMAPACPHCGAHPLRFNMNQGPVPTGQPDGTQLLVAQMWCNAPGCGKLVCMQIMGVLAPEAPDPSADIGAPKKKLWSPS